MAGDLSLQECALRQQATRRVELLRYLNIAEIPFTSIVSSCPDMSATNLTRSVTHSPLPFAFDVVLARLVLKLLQREIAGQIGVAQTRNYRGIAEFADYSSGAEL